MLLLDAVARVASEMEGIFEILSGVVPSLREHAGRKIYDGPSTCPYLFTCLISTLELKQIPCVAIFIPLRLRVRLSLLQLRDKLVTLRVSGG